LLALQAKPTVAQPASGMQFTANGHILLFKNNSFTVASTTHAMTVKFVNARKVLPKADSTASTVPEAPNMPGSMPGLKDKTTTLGTVTYTNLWKGVTLEYTNSAQGIYESTYQLVPDNKGQVHAERVCLAYNRDLTLDQNGNLVIHYPGGTLTESAPVAWQTIDGKQVPVPVAYKLRERNCVSFTLGAYQAGIPVTIDPTLSWNTFLGGSGSDECYGITTDASGNVYVTGFSTATWGNPIRAYSGGSYDGFVAKLTSAGALVWSTFLGGSGSDLCWGVITDASGNVYASGYSDAAWGSPIRAYTSGQDGFVAKLTSAGVIVWNTFLGGSGDDQILRIAKDASDNIYVAGACDATWGSPIQAFTSGDEAFLVKLTSAGALVWNTFMGGSGDEYGENLVIDASSNIIVCGKSSATWGTPVSAYTSGIDGFVAKFTSAGVRSWNTFLGGTGTDFFYDITSDASGNLYACGYSNAAWGSPISAYIGGFDILVVKLTSAGALVWSTFYGTTSAEGAFAIKVDSPSNNIYICGYENATWGTPIWPFGGGQDGFLVNLTTDGAFKWNTFMGSSNGGLLGMSIDASSNIYGCGRSYNSWGTPILAHSAGMDAFAVKITVTPAVSTLQTTNIAGTTATLNGNISSFNGTTSATDYGFCYSSTNTTPTTSDTKVSKGTTSTLGAYNSAVTGLTLGTTYYVRAYANNTSGTSYGDVVAFTTLTTPTVTTQAVTGSSSTTATGNGNITNLGNPANITAYGVCWSSTNSTPTTANSYVSNGTTTVTGAFTSAITGLTQGTLYYVRAYATNSSGTSYGSVVTFTEGAPSVSTQAVTVIGTTTATGNGNITSLGSPASITAYGVCWSSTNTTPTTADSKVTNGTTTTTGAFTSAMTGLTTGTTYYVRAYATNATGTAYGYVVTFKTGIPTVTTQAVTAIAVTTATGNGNVTGLGNPASITAYGVCWSSTNTIPTTADNYVNNGTKTTTGAFTSSITGLTTGTPYYVRAYATNATGTAYGDVVSFTTLIAPIVTTQAVTASSSASATGNGTILNLGNPASITAYGVCWSSTNTTPTTADSYVNIGTTASTGAFSADMAGLTLGTKYYVRAYATNSAGTSFGSVVSFTEGTPTVTTQALTAITTTTATGNGTITGLGSPASITAYGVCWSSTNATPTTSDSKVTNGTTTATGAFTSSITGLTTNTTYYVRAYATNATGTSYGDVVLFTTGAPTVTTQAVTAIGSTTATGNGTIISLGTPASVTAYGVCWSSTNTTPVTADNYGSVGTTTTTGAFTYGMTGLTANTTYYVRAYATNTAGTSYGNVVTFTTSSSVVKPLTLKAYLEGFWNGSTMNKCKKWDNALGDVVDLFSGTVVDTISVELHDATTYATIVYKAHGLELHADGSINTTGKSYIEIPSSYAGSYRLTVKQRNHLETTSASAVSFAGGSVSYDFTDASTKAYLSDASFTPTKLVNGKWMLYAGDVVVTTSYPEIDLDDIYAVFNQNSAKTSVYGYLAADVNGDGIVDDADLYLVFANRDKFLYIP